MTDNLSLIAAAKSGDENALERVVSENYGLVWSVVRHFTGHNVDKEDLFQLGCMGLIKAVSGFDETLGNQFSTYAVPKIAGEIRRFLRDDGTVKVSRSLKENNRKIRLAQEALSHSLGREPTLSELSEKTGFTIEEIAQAEFATGDADSLNRETNDDGVPLESLLGTDGIEERVLEKIALENAIAKLPIREQKVLNLRFFHSLTQEKCAKILGISQVQVSRIERASLKKLREYITLS